MRRGVKNVVEIQFKSIYSGVITLTSASKSITVNHGIGIAPSAVHVTLQSQVSAYNILWVEGITSTQFIIKSLVNLVNNTKIAWLAIL
jgi:hypothetical protein